MRSLFFIPIYNQCIELPALLEELQSTRLPCSELILIDNGSNDGSEALIRKSGFRHLRYEANQGVGFSFIRSIDLALKENFEVIGGLAGNGKMLPSEMDRVLSPIENQECVFVTGSRFLAGGSSPNLPAFRKSTIPFVSRIASLCTGNTITDATCGYRAIHLEVFKRARFDWRAARLFRYAFEPYIYAKVVRSALSWKEVPITMRYPAHGNRYTKIRAGRDWFELVIPWVWARIERFNDFK